MSKHIMPRGFNWLVVLEDLSSGERKAGEFEYQELKGMAAEWPTCACGQLCTVLPRDSEGGPDDDNLQTLGYAFYINVANREWCKALETFKKIERRTTHLLKHQMMEEMNK